MLATSAEKGLRAANPTVYGEFIGTSPCGDPIRTILRIPKDVKIELMQWKLILHQNQKTQEPASYKLHCEYGPAVQGTNGLGKTKKALQKEGRWKITNGTKSNPDATVIELDRAVSLLKVNNDSKVLQVLNPDRSLMIGNGGWSYTLNRTDATETPGDRALALTKPDQSYSISPVAQGPTVFGVFEGRTPFQGIARELKLPTDAGCLKAKWRVTLYQDAETQAPTTYKLEGSLYRQGVREGNWRVVRGSETDPQAIIYRLEPTATEAVLLLLEGDENVLFFLDQMLKPMVGHAEFSYTLNRRSNSSSSNAAPGR